MRRRYTIYRLLCFVMGYVSVGLAIFAIVASVCGAASLLMTACLLIGITTTLLFTCLEQKYQTKIDELDYDDLPF